MGRREGYFVKRLEPISGIRAFGEIESFGRKILPHVIGVEPVKYARNRRHKLKYIFGQRCTMAHIIAIKGHSLKCPLPRYTFRRS